MDKLFVVSFEVLVTEEEFENTFQEYVDEEAYIKDTLTMQLHSTDPATIKIEEVKV